VVIPNDAPGEVSSGTNRQFGRNGATVFRLNNNNAQNFISTGGQTAYLFVSTLYRSLRDIRVEFSWQDEVPPPPPVLSISTEFAQSGEEVTVNFRVYNNSGFSSMNLRVNIPEDLNFLRHESHPFFKDIEYVSEEGNELFNWSGTENFHEDGLILSMTFEICPNAENGFRAITAASENFEISNGGVYVRTLLLGDADNDGRITSADATLIALYLAGGDVLIDTEAADITGDGIDLFTLTVLSRWLVGHDVSQWLRIK
jgi:hypothetical protein